MGKPVPISEAKTHLSKLIERAEAGEEVIISRGSTPVVRLVPIEPVQPARRFGAMKGLVVRDAGFFDPLPEDVLRDFEGG